MVRRYAELMPRIQAQESLRMATVVAMGSNVLKRGEAARIRAEWTRAARGDRQPVKTEDIPKASAAIGLGVRRVRPKT